MVVVVRLPEWPQLHSTPAFPLLRHEDGTVRFWDASGVSLKPLYKLGTAHIFQMDCEHNDSLNQSYEEEWPPFRKVPANLGSVASHLPTWRREAPWLQNHWGWLVFQLWAGIGLSSPVLAEAYHQWPPRRCSLAASGGPPMAQSNSVVVGGIRTFGLSACQEEHICFLCAESDFVFSSTSLGTTHNVHPGWLLRPL